MRDSLTLAHDLHLSHTLRKIKGDRLASVTSCTLYLPTYMSPHFLSGHGVPEQFLWHAFDNHLKITVKSNFIQPFLINHEKNDQIPNNDVPFSKKHFHYKTVPSCLPLGCSQSLHLKLLHELADGFATGPDDASVDTVVQPHIFADHLLQCRH